MAAAKPDAVSFPIGNLFAILLVVAGVVANRLPLESARPAGELANGRQIEGLQTVTSRMWQDPFFAHDKLRSLKGAQAAPTFEEVAGKINVHIGNAPLVVLGVSVFGGPYAEDQEGRRRTRYAVVSALGAADYQPWDAEKIGVMHAASADGENAPLPPLVPFELYTSTQHDKPKVLVMWLDESHYMVSPLERYAALREAVNQFGANVTLRLIGPASSGTIDTLVNDVCVGGEASDVEPYTLDAIQRFNDIQFYSAGATTPLRRPRNRDAASDARGPAESAICDSLRAHLLRVTNTDDQLAAAVVNELANRGVRPGKRDALSGKVAHVAFVYEWDNLFSRQWRDEFVAQAGHDACEQEHAGAAPDPKCIVPHPPKLPEWMTAVRYMRGLDGADGRQGARQDKGEAGSTGADAKTGAAKPAAHGDDRADGGGQFDYLLRLAESLSAHDADLREGKTPSRNKGAIRAIGIIGNDPYDKLLVLQALRPRFPEAIFFTNDLDARLLQQAQYKWTRNMLVASSYGLQLASALQNGAAPFRDTYQAGTFLATRLALETGDAQSFPELQRCLPAHIAPARLFEIGRSFAADITTAKGEAAAAHCARALLSGVEQGTAAASAHPPHVSLFEFPAKPVLQWLALMALSALLVAMFSRTVQSGLRNLVRDFGAACRTQPRRMWIAAAGLLCLIGFFALLTIAAVQESAHAAGEPFTLFEGISMWPTQVIRFVALLAALVLLLRTWIDLTRNREALMRDFLLPKPEPVWLRPKMPLRRDGVRLTWRRLRRWTYAWWNRRFGIAGWQPDPRTVQGKRHTRAEEEGLAAGPREQRAVEVVRLWKAYGVRSRLRARIARVVPILLVFAAFSYLVVEMFGVPATPYRGAATLRLNTWLTIAFSLSISMLMFLILDAIRLCKRFVQHLQNAPSNWPDTTVRHFEKQFRIAKAQACDTTTAAATLNDWIDVQFIARHTESVMRLLWYPTVILALLLLARADVFDSWTTRGSLLAIYVALCACVVYLALSLQRSADRARETALTRMNQKLIAAKSNNASNLADQIELLAAEIRNLHRGAFLPVAQRPLVRTVLMGLGSLGGVELLNYLNIVAR